MQSARSDLGISSVAVGDFRAAYTLPMAARLEPGVAQGGVARWDVPRAAYLHIPFCRTKCVYCDFNTFAGKENLVGEYVAALVREIRSRAGETCEQSLETVYFGGGTPSLLSPPRVMRLMRALRESYGVETQAEVTLEANPGTFGRSYLEDVRDAGINRLSLGVQSLDDDTLRRLARTHNSRQAIAAVGLARAPLADARDVEPAPGSGSGHPTGSRQPVRADGGSRHAAGNPCGERAVAGSGQRRRGGHV
jgi:coproporphyrinogen III oxidase-like Fe-S oxidoreductase